MSAAIIVGDLADGVLSGFGAGSSNVRLFQAEDRGHGANGVTTLYEIGAGKVLSGLARRINRDMATAAVGTPVDVEAALAALN